MHKREFENTNYGVNRSVKLEVEHVEAFIAQRHCESILIWTYTEFC